VDIETCRAGPLGDSSQDFIKFVLQFYLQCNLNLICISFTENNLVKFSLFFQQFIFVQLIFLAVDAPERWHVICVVDFKTIRPRITENNLFNFMKFCSAERTNGLARVAHCAVIIRKLFEEF